VFSRVLKTLRILVVKLNKKSKALQSLIVQGFVPVLLII